MGAQFAAELLWRDVGKNVHDHRVGWLAPNLCQCVGSRECGAHDVAAGRENSLQRPANPLVFARDENENGESALRFDFATPARVV